MDPELQSNIFRWKFTTIFKKLQTCYNCWEPPLHPPLLHTNSWSRLPGCVWIEGKTKNNFSLHVIFRKLMVWSLLIYCSLVNFLINNVSPLMSSFDFWSGINYLLFSQNDFSFEFSDWEVCEYCVDLLCKRGAKKQSGIYFPTFALNPTLSVFWYEAATGCSFKVVFIQVNEYELVTYRESWIWASSSDELVNCSPRAPFGM